MSDILTQITHKYPYFWGKIHWKIHRIRKLQVPLASFIIFAEIYLRLEAAVISSFNTTARLVNHIQIQMRIFRYYLNSLKGIHRHHFHPVALAVFITEIRDYMRRDLKLTPIFLKGLTTPATESLPELLVYFSICGVAGLLSSLQARQVKRGRNLNRERQLRGENNFFLNQPIQTVKMEAFVLESGDR